MCVQYSDRKVCIAFIWFGHYDHADKCVVRSMGICNPMPFIIVHTFLSNGTTHYTIASERRTSASTN